MKVYKEKSCLVFDFENGKNCKYDFATHTAYGIKGTPVRDIRTQLRGYRVSDIEESCSDPAYANFIKFVKNENGKIENIGSILDNIEFYFEFEQIFSSGIKRVSTRRLLNSRVYEWEKDQKLYSWKNIPKGLLNICRKNDILLTQDLIAMYRKYPNEINTMYNTEYISLTVNDITQIVMATIYHRDVMVERHADNIFNGKNIDFYGGRALYLIDILFSAHGYNAKSLMKYLDHLATYEAIGINNRFFREFLDYLRMMSEISDKYERYPKHFLTTHAIASRNYTRMKEYVDEKKFSKCYTPEMEMAFGDYIFIYPKTSSEIKQEAAAQSNCVASYIDNVIKRECDILFLRKKNKPDESLVTIEVRNGMIVQAKQKYNYDTTKEQNDVIKLWNKAYKKIYEEKTKIVAA